MKANKNNVSLLEDDELIVGIDEAEVSIKDGSPQPDPSRHGSPDSFKQMQGPITPAKMQQVAMQFLQKNNIQMPRAKSMIIGDHNPQLSSLDKLAQRRAQQTMESLASQSDRDRIAIVRKPHSDNNYFWFNRQAENEPKPQTISVDCD